MPNEKVRYFKDYNLINEKIIYVKDKDLLGYESSNSLAFQYRYWKMKKFGISDNIILISNLIIVFSFPNIRIMLFLPI